MSGLGVIGVLALALAGPAPVAGADPAISLVKVADEATVSAGDQVGFRITAANSGAGDAGGVTVTDPLPAKAGVSWSIDAAGSDSGCSIGGGVLTCDWGTVASGASKAVHVTSATTKDSCGVLDNTAAVTTSNDGSDRPRPRRPSTARSRSARSRQGTRPAMSSAAPRRRR